MKKILFVTSRNIISTCGELRLIKNRASVLKDVYGYSTDYIAYRIRKRIQNEDIGGRLIVLRAPIDRRKLYKIVRDAILTGEYSCIILSGATIGLVPYIKKIEERCKVILDIHGTVEEYVEFRNHSILEKMIFGYLYMYTKKVEKKVVPLSDGILTVSHSLADDYKTISKNHDIKTFIVPCSISVTITKQSYDEYRKFYREKYGIANSDFVFVYSGGASPWQCVEESVELFGKIREQLGENCKMLLFSGSKELVRQYRDKPGVIAGNLSPDKVMETLCAGDFGLMLRDDYATNNYAFPNKFLEYVGSGLRVIATPYVYDVRDYIKDFDIGLIIDLPIVDGSVKELCRKIILNYDRESHFRRCEELIKKCSFKETLKAFDEFIGDNR